MDTKKTIRKVLVAGMWLVIGGGMLFLLIAAMGRQKKETCKGYVITIEDDNKDIFLSKDSIRSAMIRAAHNNIKGVPKSMINLQLMEKTLEKNTWVEDAQLYFDNHAVLQVEVSERKPIARIFTTGGTSFYIDNNDHRMPISDNNIAKVAVFTGFPEKQKWSKTDSALVKDIRTTAAYINTNPFWAAQIAQVDIVQECGPACWEFEMTPVVGNHIVRLGDGDDMDKKLNRLFTFYQQVSSKAGFDKYQTIDVRFNGQVVASKEKRSSIPKYSISVDQPQTTALKSDDQPVAQASVQAKPVKQSISSSVKTESRKATTSPQPSETSLKNKSNQKQQPKAVMRKRATRE